jgi:hypothetical protein
MTRFKALEPVLGKNPEKVSISNSEIQTFKGCRRKWMLGTYYGLAGNEEKFTGPLALGNIIHECLEIFYNTGENPVDVFNRLWNQNTEKFNDQEFESTIDEVNKFNKEGELGRIMMEGYIDWLDEVGADSDIDFIIQEDQLRYTLPHEPRVEIIAKIDARIKRRSDGSKAIMDFKTASSSNFGSYMNYAYFSEQLRHYFMLEYLVDTSTKIDGGRYRVIKKVKRTGTAKPPFYLDVDVRFNTSDRESFWIRTNGVISDIMDVRDALDRGEDDRYFAYPTQKMDWTCSTCPFVKFCTMMDDGSDFEGFIHDNFRQIDPNERYNDKTKEEGTD